MNVWKNSTDNKTIKEVSLIKEGQPLEIEHG